MILLIHRLRTDSGEGIKEQPSLWINHDPLRRISRSSCHRMVLGEAGIYQQWDDEGIDLYLILSRTWLGDIRDGHLHLCGCYLCRCPTGEYLIQLGEDQC